MRRRKRRTWRPGLAPELNQAPMIAPWLTRMAGRPVLRPDAERAAAVRLSALAVVVTTAFEGFNQETQKAIDAINAFGRAVSLTLDGRLTAAGERALFGGHREQ